MKPRQLDLFDKPSPKQLWLMNFKNPLVPRFGKEFFAKLPKGPGVYRMLNERSEIIYVGKAKNLRDRLRSYTHVNSDNSSRKVLRLVHAARVIEWEELPDEKAALLRENHLLRTLRPFFNVVNTAPHTYLFAHLKLEEEGVIIHFAMSSDPAYSDIYGAFKGLGLSYRAQKALLRLLWMSFNPCRFGFELPGILTNHRKLVHHLLPLHGGTAANRSLYAGLRRYFNGTSSKVLGVLVDRLLAREDLAPFTRELIQLDLETALEFYEKCARRNRRIKRGLKLDHNLIPQDKLDDFVVILENSEKEKNASR